MSGGSSLHQRPGHIQGDAIPAVNVAYWALIEAGRPDLAEIIVWFDEDDGNGGYLEVTDHILDEHDWNLVDKAETIARAFVGLPPIERSEA